MQEDHEGEEMGIKGSRRETRSNISEEDRTQGTKIEEGMAGEDRMEKGRRNQKGCFTSMAED